jgi:AbrB family looped-hinge helix DNA binding protein
MRNTAQMSVKVSKRYQVVLPSVARRQLEIEAGDRLLVDVQDGMIVLIPQPANYAEHLARLHRDVWDGVNTDEYIEQERNAWTSLSK